MEDLIPSGQDVRPDSDLLDILSATTGNFDVMAEEERLAEEREREARLKVQALGRWTEIAGASLGTCASLTDAPQPRRLGRHRALIPASSPFPNATARPRSATGSAEPDAPGPREQNPRADSREASAVPVDTHEAGIALWLRHAHSVCPFIILHVLMLWLSKLVTL